MKILLRLTMLALGVCVAWLGWEIWRADRAKASAVRLLARSEWAPARSQLARYLRFHAGDVGARLMLAEAFACDEALDGREAALQAIGQLQRVPDTAPQASLARVKEGSLRLLLLNQAIAGERAMRRAIDLDPANYEACYMLWKLLDLTGRSHLTEAVFWQAYELSPPGNRLNLLRDWFLSEFHPRVATAPLDQKMGFLAEGEQTGSLVESRRLYRFWSAEPDSPVIGAAIARLYLRDGMRREAREVFEEILVPESGVDDPLYLATQISIHHDFGEFADAKNCLAIWPQPLSGYEFWKWTAILLDELDHNDQQAVDAYDQALAVWPGNTDWRLLHRKSRCLERLGRHQEAEAVRSRVATVFGQMEPELHARLRQSIRRLDDPSQFEAVIDFYRKLDRQREAAEWESRLRDFPLRLQTDRANSAASQ